MHGQPNIRFTQLLLRDELNAQWRHLKTRYNHYIASSFNTLKYENKWRCNSFQCYRLTVVSSFLLIVNPKKSEKIIIITETFYDWELCSSFIDDLVILTGREIALIIKRPRYVHTFTGKKQSVANDIKRQKVSLCIYSTRVYNIRPVESSRRSSALKNYITHNYTYSSTLYTLGLWSLGYGLTVTTGLG